VQGLEGALAFGALAGHEELRRLGHAQLGHGDTVLGGVSSSYQFAVLDDATRIRALRVYERYNHPSDIDFIDYAIERFPFRIHTIRIDTASSPWPVGEKLALRPRGHDALHCTRLTVGDRLHRVVQRQAQR